MRKNSGFTLVELVVTVAILGLLVTLSMPNIKEWLHSYRLKGAAKDFYSNLQLAKMTAIKENQDCLVTFATSPDKYTVSCLKDKDGNDMVITLADYGSGIHFVAAADAAPFSYTQKTQVDFDARGLIDPPSGYRYFTNDKRSGFYRVGALSSGVLKSQRWDGGSWK